MASISIKGRKELLLISDAGAREIEKAWSDVSVPRETVIDIGGRWKGQIGDIRYFDYQGEKSPTETGSTQHWIILNDRQDTIYKKSYLTFEEAKADYDFNDLAKYGWTIEERGTTSILPHLDQSQREEIERVKAEITAKWSTKKE